MLNIVESWNPIITMLAGFRSFWILDKWHVYGCSPYSLRYNFTNMKILQRKLWPPSSQHMALRNNTWNKTNVISIFDHSIIISNNIGKHIILHKPSTASFHVFPILMVSRSKKFHSPPCQHHLLRTGRPLPAELKGQCVQCCVYKRARNQERRGYT